MDITDVRANNVKQILNALRFSDGYTKKELYQMTGLSLSTVSATCNELEQRNILAEQRVALNGVGRTPTKLKFLCENFYSVCLYMPNKITMGLSLLDFGNHVLYSKRFDISQYKTMAEVLAFAHDTYVEIAKLESIKDRCCTGVGVAISGVFDKSKGILIYTTNSNWESAPIRNLVEELFGLPCHVDTRANYCALAMRRMRPEAENLVYLYLDTEVNSGVICDGHLLRGENGHSMRIAHLPLGNPAHRCTLQACGCYGCINTEISVTGMVGDYHDYDASTPMLNRWCQLTQEIQVDPAAFAPYLKEKGTYIGTLVATLVSTFDPEILYLGGRCTEIFPYLEPNITAEVTRRCKLATQFGVQIAWDPNFNATLNEGIIQMIYDRWTPLSPVNPPLSVL